jgi:hypothetical protein
MPQVTISSSKGLEQTSGSGFSVSDVELVRSNESITPSGGSYLVTCVADVGGSLDGKYFILYNQDGDSYGIWFDHGDSGTAAPGATAFTATDNKVEVKTVANGNTAAQVATAIQGAIDGDATANLDFEVVDNSDGTITVYALHAGAMTTTTENAGDSGFTVALTDGSDTAATVDADVECSMLSVGSDVTDMDLVTVLGNGSTVGQRKNLIFVGAANGEVNVGGTFFSGGAPATLLSMNTNSVAHGAVASLVWSGSAWVVVHNVNVTAS